MTVLSDFALIQPMMSGCHQQQRHPFEGIITILKKKYNSCNSTMIIEIYLDAYIESFVSFQKIDPNILDILFYRPIKKMRTFLHRAQ
jgi:hypothetical protein